ncbi:MAG: FecR domain-containing protein [Bacteroidales bacterium]
MKTNDKMSQEYWEEMASFLSRKTITRLICKTIFLTGKEKELINYLTEMKNSTGEDKEVVDSAWESLHRRLENENLLKSGQTRSFNIPAIARIAAMVIIVIGLGITTKFLVSNKINPAVRVVSTSQTEKNVRVNLADGSTVILNRNSELTYPARFVSKERKVTLKGEAFFEITPDADSPFLVDAGKRV